MITIDDLNKVVDEGKKKNFQIRVSDVVYAILARYFKDIEVVYTVLYGRGMPNTEIKEYDTSKKIKFIKRYIKQNWDIDGQDSSNFEDITFEENKEALIKRLEDIKLLSEKGELDKKDALKMEVDIRALLNNKFSVTEKKEDHTVIVTKKYNDICVCGREIYRPTKEDIIEDLKKEYDLVPKKGEV